MLDSIIKLLIGDLEEKRIYKQIHSQLKKRLDALPKEYRFAFRKIKHYMLINGAGPDGNLTLYTDLIDLFEESAGSGKQVLDVIGSDVSGFCDELIRVSDTYTENTEKLRKKLNKEILEKLAGGNSDADTY